MRTFDEIRENRIVEATAGDHEEAAMAHDIAAKSVRQDLRAKKAHQRAAEHHSAAAAHIENDNHEKANASHSKAKDAAGTAKQYGNKHSANAHADTHAVKRVRSVVGEGYVSAAQRKAVWASKADGGKGHPDNKKEAKSADVKPEKYTDANGKTKTRMVPVVKEEAVNELDTSTLVSYRKKANKQRYSNNISKRTQRTAGVDRADKKLRKRNIDKFGDHSPKGVDRMGNRKEDYTPAQKAAKEKSRIGPKGEVGKREYGSDKSKRGFHKSQRGVSGKGDNRNTMSIFDRQPKTALQGNKPKGKLPEDTSAAVKAFLAKGGKIKKLAPGKAQGYHGKDDPGKDMHGMMDKPDTKRMGTRKKVKSMEATQVDEISKDTKKSYIKKAVNDVDNRSFAQGLRDKNPTYTSADAKNNRKIANRRAGINRALEAKETDPPFDDAKKISTTPSKDQFGNIIKNRAKHLARQAAKKAGGDMGDKK